MKEPISIFEIKKPQISVFGNFLELRNLEIWFFQNPSFEVEAFIK
jgi:hypothetical protein